MWFTEVLELATDGKHTGRFRLTATSDEDGGGPWGDLSHSHGSIEEAEKCEACDEYVSRVTGFPSRKRLAEMTEAREREELSRLKAKYND